MTKENLIATLITVILAVGVLSFMVNNNNNRYQTKVDRYNELCGTNFTAKDAELFELEITKCSK